MTVTSSWSLRVRSAKNHGLGSGGRLDRVYFVFPQGASVRHGAGDRAEGMGAVHHLDSRADDRHDECAPRRQAGTKDEGSSVSGRKRCRKLGPPLPNGERSAPKAPGEGAYGLGRNVTSMNARTPSRLSYTSMFETLITWNPHDSSTRVRSASWCNSASVECVAPSTSTMSFPSSVMKSTMYFSILCWRRNFQRASRRLRNAYQRRDSALVCEARSCRAFFLNRSIPLTPRLPRRPLPVGERYTRVCRPA